MKSTLYYGVRKLFSQAYRNKLKLINYKIQKKLVPYYNWRYGNFSVQELQSELLSKLSPDYEVLMIHSSHSSMLPMFNGSISELLKMFLEFTGPDKTLVMPAFFFGERKYNYDIVKYYSEKPFIDIHKMPSQMGIITEMFRKLPNVKISLHPTHRISALGPLAEKLVQDHEFCKTGCGKNSPFDKMTKFNTIVLGVGVQYYRSMTQTHATEDILFEQGMYPTKFVSTQVSLTVMNNGQNINHTLTVLDKTPYIRRVHPLLKRIMGKDLVEWTFHGVPIYYASADLVTQKLTETALNGISVYS